MSIVWIKRNLVLRADYCYKEIRIYGWCLSNKLFPKEFQKCHLDSHVTCGVVWLSPTSRRWMRYSSWSIVCLYASSHRICLRLVCRLSFVSLFVRFSSSILYVVEFHFVKDVTSLSSLTAPPPYSRNKSFINPIRCNDPSAYVSVHYTYKHVSIHYECFILYLSWCLNVIVYFIYYHDLQKKGEWIGQLVVKVVSWFLRGGSIIAVGKERMRRIYRVTAKFTKFKKISFLILNVEIIKKGNMILSIKEIFFFLNNEITEICVWPIKCMTNGLGICMGVSLDLWRYFETC